MQNRLSCKNETTIVEVQCPKSEARCTILSKEERTRGIRTVWKKEIKRSRASSYLSWFSWDTSCRFCVGLVSIFFHARSLQLLCKFCVYPRKPSQCSSRLDSRACTTHVLQNPCSVENAHAISRADELYKYVHLSSTGNGISVWAFMFHPRLSIFHVYKIDSMNEPRGS